MPGVPHLITQQGNRGQNAFFGDEDYAAYLDLMAESCARLGVKVWAYCLMPARVHLLAVPPTEDALRRAIGEAHRRYTAGVNTREGWRGYLWQGRFASFPMDPPHALAAARCVEWAPVRAKLCRRPWRWPWSSAAAHLAGENDVLVKVRPLVRRVDDWREFLLQRSGPAEVELLRRHERTGRPLGPKRFVVKLEKALDRALQPRRRGRKPLRRV